MICISIVQGSRQLALADMINAASQCDLLEVCLDRFIKTPDVGDLMRNKPQPAIMCCRRQRDGGNWKGSEEQRLALLRQCIVSKAEYVEIELDVADQIAKFPPTKRIISYTNLAETPRDIARIYAEAQKKHPDIIKLATLARTPEEAWPLVRILAKPGVPTVVLGLGQPGLMVTVLAKKIGVPWTYAALEPAMQAFPGQPTVHDLNNVYSYSQIDRSTRLVGVTGFGPQQVATVAVLNQAFLHLGLSARCLPLGVGGVGPFRRMIDLVKLGAVVVADEHSQILFEVASELEPEARAVRAADVIVQQAGKWHGSNTRAAAAVSALEQAGSGAGQRLQGKVVMVVGATPTGRAVARAVQAHGAVPIIASRDPSDAQLAAQLVGCRQMLREAMYSTMHDVLIVCSEENEKIKGQARSGHATVHSGYLKPNMTVMDLTSMPYQSTLLDDARAMGCTVVAPREVFLSLMEQQVWRITEKRVPRELLEEALTGSIAEQTS